MVNSLAIFALAHRFPKYGLCRRRDLQNENGLVVAQVIEMRRGRTMITGDLMAADKCLAKEEEARHGA